MSKADLKVVLMRPQDLIPYDLNAKKHDKEQIARICQAITKFGWDVPIVVDKHNVIIKGHGRREAAIELGLAQVPVIVRHDLNPEQVRAARLADNRVALSDIDPEKLRSELETLDFDMGGIFDDKELAFMDAELGTMNTSIFLDDMDQTVADQQADLGRRAEEAAASQITLAKAFGFKDIPGPGQIHVTRFMARIEAETGKKGADALIAHLETL